MVGDFVGAFVGEVDGVLVGLNVLVPLFSIPGVRKSGPVHIAAPITRCNE